MMKLTLKKSFKSIIRINDIDLPDFTVLTGLNGSGKTHIIEGLKNGSIVLDNTTQVSVVHFCYSDILLGKTSSSSSGNYRDFLNQFIPSEEKLWRHKISMIYSKHLTISDASGYRHLILEEGDGDKSIWNYKESDVSKDLWNRIISFKNDIKENVFYNENFQKFKFCNYIISSYKKNSIIDKHNGFHCQEFLDHIGGLSIDKLVNLYRKYVKDEETYAINKFNMGSVEGKSNLKLEFQKKQTKPWNILDESLKELKLFFQDKQVFNFSITNPEQGEFSVKNIDSFNLEFIDNKTNKLIKYNDLSSGEQVMLTLLLQAFDNNRSFLGPSILLLDEIDASLHPSMIKAMLMIIQKTFLDKGTKVILATHSPTTISLVEEESVHVVNIGDVNPKIEKKTKLESLEILTEGYATIEDLLQFGETDKERVIISEGTNYKYLNKAKEYFDIKDQVEILKMKRLGVSQLRTLYDFLRRFNSSKKIIFVWDCDYIIDKTTEAKKNLINGQNVHNRVFIFETCDNSKSARGIENLFTISDTKEYLGEFDGKGPKRKDSFMNHILQNSNENIFQNFQPLFEFVLSDDLYFID